MATSSVLWLSEITPERLFLVGGKAANLGAIARWGLPSLDGFCVTTDAYRNFITARMLDDEIANILGDIDIDSLDQVAAGSKQIRELIDAADLLPATVQEINSVYIELGEPSVAVRSSATAEDLPEASFAGQHESYLNIRGQDQLLRNVRRCWGSLWTPRAIRYRALLGLDNARVYMAVVVQIMLQAEVAGVMFTINPLNDRSDEIVINASYGLGEAIVNGSVTPDTAILDKRSLAILERQIGSKETMIVHNPKGETQTVQVSVEQQIEASLSDDDFSKLGELGKQVEKLFGSPQDIEWAWAKGNFYLLQSRPVTVQQPAASHESPRYNPFQRFLLDFLLDYFPAPPYHFDRSILLSLLGRTLQLSEIFGLVPPEPSEVLRAEPDGTITLAPMLSKPTWQTPLGIVVGSIQAIRSLAVDPGIWQRERWPSVAQSIEHLLTVDVQGMTDQELINLIHDSLVLRDEEIFGGRRDYILGGWIAMSTLPAMLKLVCGQDADELYSGLMSDLDHPTASMNKQLRELARLAASLPGVQEWPKGNESQFAWSELETTEGGRTFLSLFQEFIDQFGARSGMLMPAPSMPAWEDNPQLVLSLIAAMLRNSSFWQDNFTKVQRGKSADAYVRVMMLAERFPFGILGIHHLVRFLIRRAKAMMTERDWIIFAYEQATHPIRMSMREIGDRLMRRGVLIKAADIRFLSLAEVTDAFTHRATAELIDKVRLEIRRRKMARIKSQANWPTALAEQETADGDVLLEGVAASPGIASGTARIILSESRFLELNPGELLVVRATNPAWTPLFAIASGVIADTGGPLSHAAIVAREYGIPAVLGTKSATTVMKSGEGYILDGTQGHITRR